MKHFKDYLKRYKDIWLWTFVFTVLCHGLMLLSDYVGIDTSEAIMTKGSNHYFVCLNMGRQSLVFLKWITGTLLINPYVVGVLSIIFLWFSGILWTYLFSYLTNTDTAKGTLLSSMIYLSSVLFVETFYFKVQCTEFTIDFCLIALSLLWTIYFIESKKIRYYIGSVLMMLIYMGTYQALTICYVAGAQMCFFLYFYFKAVSSKKYEIKEMWIFILKSVITFLSGFIINQVITKIFFSKGNNYYNDLMHWGTKPFKDCIIEIVKYIGRFILGNNIYYSFIFTCLMIVCFIIVTGISFKRKITGKILIILDLLTILISPAYLSIALGGNVVYRTQVIYPYLTLFIIFVLFSLFKTISLTESIKKIYITVISVTTGIIIFSNMNNDLRLEYTDKMRNNADSVIANDLINRIENVQNDDSSLPVYFHGKYEKELNPSCIYGESIGKSMFAHDTDVEPEGYYSSIRCIAYISQFGKTYNIYNEPDKYNDLARLAEDMPCYPKDGCVSVKNGIVIVNLSK